MIYLRLLYFVGRHLVGSLDLLSSSPITIPYPFTIASSPTSTVILVAIIIAEQSAATVMLRAVPMDFLDFK